MAKPTFGCGRKECGCSTFIDEETVTFGTGELSMHGIWEFPCKKCAEAWLKFDPTAKVHPDPTKDD